MYAKMVMMIYDGYLVCHILILINNFQCFTDQLVLCLPEIYPSQLAYGRM